MKSGHTFFTCLLFAFMFIVESVNCQSPAILSYELSLDTTALHVTLTYRPVESDSTTFIYGEPNFGGQPDIFDAVQRITLITDGTLRVDRSKRSITLVYTTGLPVTLQYDIVDTFHESRGLRGELFRPIIQKDYFYTHGINVFLEPKLRNYEGKISQDVTWTSLPSFPIFQSYDPDNQGTRTSTGDFESFRMTLLTGASDIIIDRSDEQGIRNYLVLRSHKSPEFNPSVKTFFTKFNLRSREFWNDYNDKYYSLVLQPYQHSTRRISGIAMQDGFLGKFHGDSTLKQDQIKVLAHEMSHHWVGVKIEMSTTHQWFGEGFNDYITFFTLVSAGLMTPADFEKQLNSIINSLYVSEARHTPNEKVFENYWKMGDDNKLPYWRGGLFAFYLDNKISVLSKGKRNIRDLMLAIFQFVNKQKEGYELTLEDFINLTSAFVPRTELEKDLEVYIIKGIPIPFTSSMLEQFYQVSEHNSLPSIKVINEKKFLSHFQLK